MNALNRDQLACVCNACGSIAEKFNKEIQSSYKNGKLEGKKYHYSTDGTILKEDFFVEGLPYGEIKIYDHCGRLTTIYYHYSKREEPDSLKVFDLLENPVIITSNDNTVSLGQNIDVKFEIKTSFSKEDLAIIIYSDERNDTLLFKSSPILEYSFMPKTIGTGELRGIVKKLETNKNCYIASFTIPWSVEK